MPSDMPRNYSIGIEEEYFLVDATTKMVAPAMPEDFLNAAKADARHAGDAANSCSRRSRSSPRRMPTWRPRAPSCSHLRQTMGAIAAEHGLAILAAGTHPTALWGQSQQTPEERYDTVMNDLQMIGQRNMLCGMHVHVELPDPDDRVDVMCRMLPYLPLFIALSTSSPFWQSRAPGSRAIGSPPMTSCRAPACPSCSARKRGVRRLYRGAGEGRRDRGFELRVVGDPAFAEASDAGAARARLLHAASTTRLRSPRSTARWRAGWCAIRGSTGTSTR